MRCTKDYIEKKNTYKRDENDKLIYEEINHGVCNGPIKPEVIFYNQEIPDKFFWGWERITNKRQCLIDENPDPPFEDGGCDLVIVIGTTLKVGPFKDTIKKAGDCPKVLINMENTDMNDYDFDDLKNHPERLFLQGKCDEILQKIVNEVGWTKEFQNCKPK